MTKFAKDLDSNKKLKSFLEGFYKISDTKPPVQGDEYVDYFTPEATLLLGANQAKGSSEIRQLRQNIWSNESDPMSQKDIM